MTSLARQLKRLTVPHTQAVLLRDKRRPSLLFDPKEAANLDKEAVFALGQCGLEELETINDKFEEFGETLFNLSSQNWERGQQTQEVNDQLDKTVNEFLVLLSAYFPLKSSHKALEWLIYRYHVHLYNVDQLVLTLLPYHETKMFVRVLQLLQLNDPTTRWHWLLPCAKNGVPLARATLVNHCRKDPGFLALICDIVPQFIKCHGPLAKEVRPAVALFVGVMLGSLQRKEDVTEKMLSVVIPRLTKGLRSRCVEHKVACYMAFAQLLVEVQLQETVLSALLPVLSKHMCHGTDKEALSCLALVYQTQQYDHMPKRTFKHICRTPGIIQLLTSLSQQYDTGGLLRAVLDRLVPLAVAVGDAGAYSSTEGSDGETVGTGKPQYATLLLALLGEVRMSDKLLTDTTCTLMEQLVAQRQMLAAETGSGKDEALEQPWRQTTRGFLAAVERRLAPALEEAIDQQMAALGRDQSKLQALQEIVSLTTTPVKYEVVPDTSTSLLLGLRHAQPNIRILTLRHLAAYMRSSKIPPADFLEDLLLERLADDSLRVLMAVLNMKETLVTLVKADRLCQSLVKLLDRAHHNVKWKVLVKPILHLLCQESLACETEDLELCLLPYLLITSPAEKHLGPARIILEKATVQQCPNIAAMSKEWLAKDRELDEDKSATKVATLNLIVIESMVKSLKDMPAEQQTTQLQKLASHSRGSTVCTFLALVVMATLVQAQATPDAVLTLQTLLPLVAENVKKAPRKDKATAVVHTTPLKDLLEVWVKCLELPDGGGLPQSCLLYAVDQSVRAIRALEIPGQMWDADVHPAISLIIQLLEMLTQQTVAGPHGESIWLHSLKALIQDSLPKVTWHKVLCCVWMREHLDASSSLSRPSPTLHVASYHLFHHQVAGLSEAEIYEVLAANSPVILSLLVSLFDRHEAVRHGALSALCVIRDHCRRHLGVHKVLISKVVKHQEEILADHTHTTQLLGSFFSRPVGTGASPGTKSRQELLQGSLRTLLTWIADPTTPPRVKERLLAMLAEVPHAIMMDSLLPLGHDILHKCQGDPSVTFTDLAILQHVLNRIDESSAGDMQVLSHNGLMLLLESLQQTVSAAGMPTPQSMALEKVTRSMFNAVPAIEVQRKITSTLVDIWVQATNSDRASSISQCLRQLKLNGEHIQHELLAEGDRQVASPRGKRQRISQKEAPLNYKRLTLVLEVLQARRKVKDAEQLAAMLFRLLSRLLADEAEDTEYCKQLALSCLLSICSHWSQDTKPHTQESLSVEVLVQCVRNSPSPQTQQQALMLMSAIAPLYPEYILHNVMSVFTFMGSKMLLQDDAYSFQIITKTIHTVVPAIIKACASRGDASQPQELLLGILRVFVDARHHIPKHRSLLLFTQLVEHVGVADYLWTVLVLVMEGAVRMRDVPVVKDSVIVDDVMDQGLSSIDKDMELAINISSQFPMALQLQSVTKVLTFLLQLVELHTQQTGTSPYRMKKGGKGVQMLVIQVQSLSPPQLRMLQYHCTRLVAALLARDDFVTQVVGESLAEQAQMAPSTVRDFQAFVQQCLLYLARIVKVSGSPTANVGGTTGKFWRALLHKVYDVLDKVNYLLPSGVFFEVVTALMKHDVLSIRRKALELLNNKLQKISLEHLTDPELECLLSIVDELVDMSRPHESRTASSEAEADVMTSRQMALFSLKLLCKLLGPRYPKAFLPMFGVSIELLSGGASASSPSPAAMQGSGLLCVAELCASLKAHALPHLRSFMPPLLAILHNTALLETNEMLLVCSLTAIQKVVTSLAHFISPYLPDILLAVCNISCFVSLEEVGKKPDPSLRLKAVRHQLSTAVAPRVLVPVLSQTFSTLLDTNQCALIPLMEMSQVTMETMSKEDMMAQHGALLTYFCQAMDLRNQGNQLKWDAMDAAEAKVMDAIIAMVMRLSENSFRPFFYKVYDWSSQGDSSANKNRQLSFFRLCQRLAENLRSLFNLFVGHIISAMCQILEQNNSLKGEVTYFGSKKRSAEKSCLLLGYVMGCLYQCLLHDTEGLVTGERFSSLMQPLVDQIENFVGEDAAYEKRISVSVMPCISQLAVASKNDASWKALNYQVLLKTRHTTSKVRFAALRVVADLASKLGDEYMTLLPETIPFLAELMEDDCEEVEKQCQEVIGSLEGLLGESLQQYF